MKWFQLPKALANIEKSLAEIATILRAMYVTTTPWNPSNRAEQAPVIK